MLRQTQMLHLPKKKLALNYIFPPYQPVHMNELSAENNADESSDDSVVVESILIEEQVSINQKQPVATD